MPFEINPSESHAAECTTGPQFNQIANEVSAMMTATIKMWTANLRTVILSTPQCSRHRWGAFCSS